MSDPQDPRARRVAALDRQIEDGRRRRLDLLEAGDRREAAVLDERLAELVAERQAALDAPAEEPAGPAAAPDVVPTTDWDYHRQAAEAHAAGDPPRRAPVAPPVRHLSPAFPLEEIAGRVCELASARGNHGRPLSGTEAEAAMVGLLRSLLVTRRPPMSREAWGSWRAERLRPTTAPGYVVEDDVGGFHAAGCACPLCAYPWADLELDLCREATGSWWPLGSRPREEEGEAAGASVDLALLLARRRLGQAAAELHRAYPAVGHDHPILGRLAELLDPFAPGPADATGGELVAPPRAVRTPEQGAAGPSSAPTPGRTAEEELVAACSDRILEGVARFARSGQAFAGVPAKVELARVLLGLVDELASGWEVADEGRNYAAPPARGGWEL